MSYLSIARAAVTGREISEISEITPGPSLAASTDAARARTPNAPVARDAQPVVAVQTEAKGSTQDARAGSIRPLEILEHVEATMGIRLVREGDTLRMQTRPDTDISAARERVRNLRDILYEEVLQRDIVEFACGPAEQFDRSRFDALFTLWRDTYGVPWDTPADLLRSAALTHNDAMNLGA